MQNPRKENFEFAVGAATLDGDRLGGVSRAVSANGIAQAGQPFVFQSGFHPFNRLPYVLIVAVDVTLIQAELASILRAWGWRMIRPTICVMAVVAVVLSSRASTYANEQIPALFECVFGQNPADRAMFAQYIFVSKLFGFRTTAPVSNPPGRKDSVSGMRAHPRSECVPAPAAPCPSVAPGPGRWDEHSGFSFDWSPRRFLFQLPESFLRFGERMLPVGISEAVYLDWQLYHLLGLEFGTRNVDQDVADTDFRCSRQFEHKAGVESIDGLDELPVVPVIRPVGFMRFVQNHGGMDEFQDVNQALLDPSAAAVLLQVGVLFCKLTVCGQVVLLGKERCVAAAVPEYLEKVLAPFGGWRTAASAA